MKSKKKYTKILWGVCGLSTLSTVLLGVSLYSERWVVSTATSHADNSTVADINYGLFSGMVVRQLHFTSEAYTIKMACLFENNVCAWSCLETSEQRAKELKKLYRDGSVIFACKLDDLKSLTIRDYVEHILSKTFPVNDIDDAEDNDDDDVKEYFINASLWLTVVVTLFISLAVGVTSTLITLYNIHHSAMQTVFMIQSLIVWYSAAALGLLLPFTLWGIEYYSKISVNVATTETIMGTLDTANRAILGCSYWSLMVSLSGFVGCIMLLKYRQSLFEARPQFIYPVQNCSSNLSISHIY